MQDFTPTPKQAGALHTLILHIHGVEHHGRKPDYANAAWLCDQAELPGWAQNNAAAIGEDYRVYRDHPMPLLVLAACHLDWRAALRTMPKELGPHAIVKVRGWRRQPGEYAALDGERILSVYERSMGLSPVQLVTRLGEEPEEAIEIVDGDILKVSGRFYRFVAYPAPLEGRYLPGVLEPMPMRW